MPHQHDHHCDPFWHLALTLVRLLGVRAAKPAVQATYDFLRDQGAPQDVLDAFLAATTHIARIVKGTESCEPTPTLKEGVLVDLSSHTCPACHQEHGTLLLYRHGRGPSDVN